nr:IS110 family transposase [Nitriliruptor alkaliphilus]
MVHVHGRDVALRAARIGRIRADRRLLVPVDVGKHEAMALVADATGERLVAPFTFSLDRPGLVELVRRVDRVADGRSEVQIEVGVEAAGHYHRPVTASSMLPMSWTLVELNPAHVTEQRRVLGKRGIKTDQIDLAAMFDLLLAGRGLVVTSARMCCSSCRRGQRCATGASGRSSRSRTSCSGRWTAPSPAPAAAWPAACSTPRSDGW